MFRSFPGLFSAFGQTNPLDSEFPGKTFVFRGITAAISRSHIRSFAELFNMTLDCWNEGFRIRHVFIVYFPTGDDLAVALIKTHLFSKFIRFAAFAFTDAVNLRLKNAEHFLIIGNGFPSENTAFGLINDLFNDRNETFKFGRYRQRFQIRSFCQRLNLFFGVTKRPFDDLCQLFIGLFKPFLAVLRASCCIFYDIQELLFGGGGEIACCLSSNRTQLTTFFRRQQVSLCNMLILLIAF